MVCFGIIISQSGEVTYRILKFLKVHQTVVTSLTKCSLVASAATVWTGFLVVLFWSRLFCLREGNGILDQELETDICESYELLTRLGVKALGIIWNLC